MVNINVYATDEINHIKVPKLTPFKWPDFKSAISECLNRAVGKNNIPLSYVIHKEQVGNFKEYYDTRREKLISRVSYGTSFPG